MIFWAGYAVWTWLVYDWAAEHGHQLLLGGYHPWYLAVAAVTYWPVACSLWWSMYSKAGPVPWLRG
ncbi:hypothetical protein ACLQ2S_26125 [Micromonospora sp. DT48]|uniref:hypothetical protein n=1 Tax=Micromonospora sp. DT48 TaxID=3393429 RepID=UPI003CEB47A2